MTARVAIRPAMGLAVGFALILCEAAAAQTLQEPVRRDSASIADNGPGGPVGVVAVNAAAGTGNQQANAAVMAIGKSAVSDALVLQRIAPSANADDGAVEERERHAAIETGAFSGAEGLVSVNVTAGADNQQANLAVFAIGIDGPIAADALLSQSRAEPEPQGGSGGAPGSGGDAVAELGDGAFTGASGLVQVSLLGGERNSSANTFALTFRGGEGE